MSAKHDKKPEEIWLRSVVEVAKGTGLALAVAVGILVLVSALVCVGLLGRETEIGCVVTAGVVGTVVGGLYATGRCTRGRLLVGVCVGVMAFLVLLTVGTLCLGGVAGVGEVKVVCLACLLGGVLSGVLPALGKKRGRRR